MWTPIGGEYTALSSADWRDFVVSAGLTKTAAIKVAAAIELGKRLDSAYDKRTRENFGNPENVSRFFMSEPLHEEAMKWAIRYKAYGLILVHNHPSGYPEPSKEDIELTKNFAEAAKFVDCEVLDHVIIGDGIYTSLHDRGVI